MIRALHSIMLKFVSRGKATASLTWEAATAPLSRNSDLTHMFHACCIRGIRCVLETRVLLTKGQEWITINPLFSQVPLLEMERHPHSPSLPMERTHSKRRMPHHHHLLSAIHHLPIQQVLLIIQHHLLHRKQ